MSYRGRHFSSFLFILCLSFPGSLQADRISQGLVKMEILENAPERVVARYRVEGVQTGELEINGENYTEVLIPGTNNLDRKGFPALPRWGRNYLISASGEPSLRVLKMKARELQVRRVVPSKGSILRNVDPGTVPYTFSSFYREGGVYPESNFLMGRPFKMRKLRGVNVLFHPVQYDASRNVIKIVEEAEIEIRVKRPVVGSSDAMVGADPVDEGMVGLFQNTFSNFKGVQTFHPSVDRRGTSHLIQDTGRVLMITHPSFAEALKPLIAWKVQKGMQVWVADLEQTGNTSEAIRFYIKDMYEKHQISYVLLVGDAEFVPTRLGVHGFARGNEADPMYGLVDGDDSYPDLIVSRLSVETPRQLESVVQKILLYERQPDETDGQWYSRAMGIASEEGSPTDAERMDLLRDRLVNWHYRGGVDQFYGDRVEASDIADAIHQGRGLINYTGHGTRYRWTTSGFNSAYVNQLRNFEKFPFIVSVACLNGDFAGGESFAETWLRANQEGRPTGAIAVFASSIDQAWVPPTVGQKAITELLTEEKYNTVGTLFFHGSIAVLEDGSRDAEETFETWHIFGDASVKVRTKRPDPIRANVPAEIREGVEELHFVVDEKNIQVGVVRDGALLGAGYSDEHGVVSIRLPVPLLPSERPVMITLTGFNKIPLVVESYVR